MSALGHFQLLSLSPGERLRTARSRRTLLLDNLVSGRNIEQDYGLPSGYRPRRFGNIYFPDWRAYLNLRFDD